MISPTSPRHFAFVLMPFSEAFNDVYQLGIMASCEEAGAYCERVDEQFFEGTILQRIYNQIARADFIIADMTGRNANVFYEVGYAHALGKRVLLLTQRLEDIPFDMQHYPHVIYGGSISKLKQDLLPRIRWCMDQKPGESSSTFEAQLYLSGERMETCDTLKVGVGLLDTTLPLKLDIHNRGSRTFKASYAIALVAPDCFRSFASDVKGEASAIQLPGGKCLHYFRVPERVMPDAWGSALLARHSPLRHSRPPYGRPFRMRTPRLFRVWVDSPPCYCHRS